MASNAAQYLSRVLGAMTSGKITELKEKQRKRVAAIITGMQVLSKQDTEGKPRHHAVLKIEPTDFENIKKTLTTKATADKVAQIGARSPTMLAKNEQNLVHWETRSTTTKTELARAVKQLAIDIDKNHQQGQKKPQQQQPQKQEPAATPLPSPQPNLSKPA
jgi:hypothetical protein